MEMMVNGAETAADEPLLRLRLIQALLQAPTALGAVIAPPGCGASTLLTQVQQHAQATGLPVQALTADRNASRTADAIGLFARRPGSGALLVLSGLSACSDDSFATQIVPALLEVRLPNRLIFKDRSLRSPALRTARLRRAMTVLTAADLRFTTDEALQLLAGSTLSLAGQRALAEFSGGWAAALDHLRPRAPHGAATAGPACPPLFNARLPLALSDWYETEICQILPPETLDLLCDLAVVERFTPDMLARLPLREGQNTAPGWALVQPLLQENVFLSRCHASDAHFCLQPALAAHLRDRLRRHNPPRAREMLEFAINWWQPEEGPDRLVRHALALDDRDRAARLIEAAGGIRMDLARHGTMAHLMAFQTVLAREMPLLFFGQIYSRSRIGRIAEADILFTRACEETEGFTRLSTEANALEIRGWKVTFDVFFAAGLGRPITEGMLDNLRGALRDCLRASPVLALTIASVLAYGLNEHCLFDEARAVCELVLPLGAEMPDARVLAFNHLHRIRTELMSGTLERATIAAEAATRMTDGEAGSYEVVTRQLTCAHVLFEADQGPEALALLQDALPASTQVYGFIETYADSADCLIQLLYEAGDAAGAETMLTYGEAFAQVRGLTRLSLRLAACRLRFAAPDGDPEAENRLRRALDTLPPTGVTALAARLALAEQALQRGRADDARRQLDPVCADGWPATDQRLLADLMVTALRCDLQLRRYSGALHTAGALADLLARAGLLRRQRLALPWLLAARDQAPTCSRRLSPRALHQIAELTARHPATTAGRQLATGVLLSPRESEIMALIAEGLNSKEIGRRLEISDGTVKTHRKKIHEKLRVSTRSQAIQRARELHLI